MKPQDALSPRDRLDPNSLKVIFTSNSGWWSLATMTWDGEEQEVGIRWNGDLNDPNDKGNPRSHGQGTWFILPNEMAFFAKAFAEAMKSQAKEEAEAKAKQSSGIV